MISTKESFKIFLLALFSFMFSIDGFSKIAHYELTVRNEKMNLSGKKEVNFALTVNHGIPAPTLEFTEGDDAEILVKNELPSEEVSIHWHGILLPPEEDGVSYVNTPPIHSGQSRLFKFKIRQNGTYWYHSHTMLQEQKGVYGAIVIHPKKKSFEYDKNAVVVLSDWSDENADQILKNLRKDGDYYLYKKNTVRSYFGALNAGGLTTYLENQWLRMGGMDLSDVGYDAFLMNGKKDSQLLSAKPGEKIRIRMINAAASSYFRLSMGVPMTVVAADGIDITPVQTNEILMGMAETYDLLFTVPEHKNYELRATAQDGTGYASTWIGSGEKMPATMLPAPDLYASMDHQHQDHVTHHHSMEHGASAVSHHHSHHGEEEHSESIRQVDVLTVDSVQANKTTVLPKGSKIHDLKLVLGGSMDRYVWHINGKSIQQDRLISVREGEVVRFTFVNETMMHHPMHLHGHFFRVLNQFGDRSPLKHTVDVPPHGSRTIEFYANEPGQWMLHCHNLYHMKTGMARVVRYTDFKLSPEMEHYDKHDPHLHDHLYFHTRLEAANNHVQGQTRVMRTWDEIDLRLESASVDGSHFFSKKKWETEADLVYRRWISNFLNLFGGATLYDEKGYGTLGFEYTLPFLIKTSVSMNHERKVRLDIEKRFQWSKSFYSDADLTWRPSWGGKRDAEFELSFMYAPSWGWAAGLMLTEKSLGFGAQVQF